MSAGEDAPLSPRKPRFTDPLGRWIPALERCMVRHRALEFVLILHHAEELKRSVIDTVATQKDWRRRFRNDGDQAAPVKPGKQLSRAFDWLVGEGVLTADERAHMVALIDRRNEVAHHLDQVTADLSTERRVREWLDYYPDRKTHDHETLDALRAARRLLSDRMIAHSHVLTLDFRGMFFETTERVLTADLKALDRRIRKLIKGRRAEIAAVNSELSLEGTGLTGVLDPSWPENRHSNGCLTPRGIETCYRLYDLGRSPMAVAHLMNLSLVAARRRYRQWPTAGGADREKASLEALAGEGRMAQWAAAREKAGAG